MKLTRHLLSIAVAGLLASPAASFADNAATAFTKDGNAVIGEASILAGTADANGWTKVLSTTLNNSGTFKDLVIGLSFETSLFTNTMVKSSGGNKSTATADAEIKMRVLVDGQPVAPGDVIFDKRHQELWASLGGNLTCSDLNGDGIISFDECSLTDEEIGLILNTTAAHTFNFLATNIGSGSHTIEAYAQLSYNGAVVDGTGAADASASLGKGTLSVLQVQDATMK